VNEKLIDEVMGEAEPVRPADTTIVPAAAQRPEVAIAVPIENGRLAPTEFGQLPRLAMALYRANSLPKAYDKLTPEQAVGRAIIAMGYGMPLGLTPFQAVKSVAVVNGVPSIWGDDMLGLVYRSGLVDGIVEEGWDELEKDGTAGDKTVAWSQAKRKGSATVVRRTFGAADAKAAQLWTKTGPWASGYRKRMLQRRARAWLLQDLFPDALGGLGMAEEQEDLPARSSDAAKINEKIDGLGQGSV